MFIQLYDLFYLDKFSYISVSVLVLLLWRLNTPFVLYLDFAGTSLIPVLWNVSLNVFL